MLKQKIKALVLGRAFPVMRGNLRGTRLIIDRNLNALVIWKDYEPDKQMALSVFSEREKVFFDLGANVGLHSYLIAKKFPGNKIHSFEPLHENVAYIKSIVNLNAFENIQVHELACGSFDGHINFETGATNLQGKITDKDTGLKVNLRTLDSLIEELKIEPALLKIDVEGAERHVLDGFRKNIQRLKPILVIELHNPTQDKLVAEFLLHEGFEIFRLDGSPAALAQGKFLAKIRKPTATWPDPDGVYGNIIAIPPSKMDIYRGHLG